MLTSVESLLCMQGSGSVGPTYEQTAASFARDTTSHVYILCMHIHVQLDHTFAGWLERQKGVVLNHVMVLMQAEVERFHAGMSLLHDYHHARTQEAAGGDSVVLVRVSRSVAVVSPDRASNIAVCWILPWKKLVSRVDSGSGQNLLGVVIANVDERKVRKVAVLGQDHMRYGPLNRAQKDWSHEAICGRWLPA